MPVSRVTRSPGLSLQEAARIVAVCPLWFLTVYLLFSTLNSDFDHQSDPVSALGAIGEPLAPFWNFAGFVVPGLMIALFGRLFAVNFRASLVASAAGTSIAISGLLLASAGIFPSRLGLFAPGSSVAHEASGWGAAAAFLVGGLLFSWTLLTETRIGIRALYPLILVVGTLAYQVIGPDQWWLGQRVGFACYFVWIGVVGHLVARLPASNSEQVEPVMARTLA
jgi:hypothetical membrane protein